MSGSIHATAIVAPDAVLGEGVEIGAYGIVGPGVVIGARTRIGAHAAVHCHTRLGADNVVHPFASVGDAPQDKKYQGEPTRLEIGDRNVIREFVTLNRGTTKDRGVTTIGSDNLFMAYSHVAHDCVVGNQCVLANSATLGGHVVLGDWVDHGRVRRHPPVLQGRRARVPREQCGRDARRAAVRHGGGRPGQAAQHQLGRPQAARLQPAADPQPAQRLSRPLPLGPAARAGARAADGGGQEQPEVQLLVDFIPQSTRSLVR